MLQTEKQICISTNVTHDAAQQPYLDIFQLVSDLAIQSDMTPPNVFDLTAISTRLSFPPLPLLTRQILTANVR